ncbi:MAG TPA: KH domain-containing protein [Patescibacteria group bacterium]|nr:KH domain-containing protein [Patescibacteria group bacterium]
MKDLLEFLLKNVLGKEEFEIVETEEDGRLIYTIKTAPENIGLVIGRGGGMIKSLRNLLKVRATLEQRAVSLNVSE